MIRRIQRLEVAGGLVLRAKFEDGREVLYDVEEDVREIPDFGPLATVPGLFAQASLDQSRTCVFWNDMIDLPSDVIYEYGTVVKDGNAQAFL